MLTITPSELRAIEIAWCELESYISVMGQDLDQVEEDGIQLEKLQWTERKLARLIERLS